jgi:putative inorganic carbon (HCO3(-)) transporter
MQLRDLVVALCVVASVPLCFRWPWFGGVVWGWLSSIYPYRLVIGRVGGVPFVWLVIAATLAGLARTAPRYRLPRSREMYLLLGFWAFCALTTLTALYPARAWPCFLEISRVLSLTLVVIALCQERRKLIGLMWATPLSLACYAVVGVVWVWQTGGHAGPLYGPRASDLQNNNDFAAALIAALPFFVFLGECAPRRWMTFAALGLFCAAVFAILGTYSRAAVCGLIVVLLLLAMLRQWRAIAAAGATWVAFLLCTAPGKWVARVDTIRTFQQEHSAAMRLPEWYVAWRLGLDHPLLGAGFEAFTPESYLRYVGYADYHNAHNHFLQVFAEHGLPGLALYTALIVCTLMTLRRIAARATAPDETWLRAGALAVLVGLIGFIVDGQFHVLSYRTVFFDLLALSIMLDALTRAPAHVVAAAHDLPR